MRSPRRWSLGSVTLVLMLAVAPASAQVYMDSQEDPEGDVKSSGSPPDTGQIDIIAVDGRLDGLGLNASVRLASPATWQANMSLNHQILFDIRDGTGDDYPAGSGWDGSLVCTIGSDGAQAPQCSLFGVAGSIESAGFTDEGWQMAVALEEGANATHLVVGAGAAMQGHNDQGPYSALDFTQNAELGTSPPGSPGASGPGDADAEGPSLTWVWWLLAAVAAGAFVGWWWSRPRKP